MTPADGTPNPGLTDGRLWEDEGMFRRLFSQSPIGTVIVGMDFRFRRCNEAFCRFVGYSEKYLCDGMTFLDITFPADRAIGVNEIREIARNERDAARVEKRYVRKDGKVAWGEVDIRMVRDATGCPEHLLAIVQDVTARKVAEEALQETEEQFRTLATLSPVGIYLTDPDGNCQYANPAWCRMAGLSPAEALGKGWARGLHPDDREMVFARWQQMVASGGQWGLEYRFRDRDGKVTLVHGTASAQRDASGKVVGYVGVNVDISERKRAETALRVAHEQLVLAKEAAEAGVWNWDMSTGKLVWSAELYRLFGIDPERDEATFETWRCVMHPEDREAAERKVYEAVQAGKRLENDYRIVLPSGEVRWIHATGKAVYDGGGHPVAMSGICLDITAPKRLEESLLESKALYHSLFENMLNGFVHCRMLFENGRPQDFVYLSVNNAYGALTGLTDVVGKRISEVIPGIHRTDPQLLDVYGRVTLTGKAERFEVYRPALQKWLSVSAYRPQEGEFAAVFEDITERRMLEESLKLSEERYHALFDQAGDGIFVMDVCGNILSVNEQFARMHGLSVEEMLKKGLRGLDVEGTAPVADRVRRILAGETLTFEVEHYHRDGHTFPLSVTAKLVSWGDERVILAIHRDISARRQAEAALRTSEEKYAKVFHDAPVWIAISDFMDGTYLEVNEEALRASGFSREEVIGHASTAIGWITSESRSRLIEEVHANGRISGLEMAFRAKDGRMLHGLVSGEPLLIGGRACLLTVTVDITERKRAEASLREAGDQRQAILDTAMDGFVLFDEEARIVDVNQTYCRMIGYSREELLGKTPNHLRPPGEEDDVNARLREIKARKQVRFESRHRRKDGSDFDVEVSVQYRAELKGCLVTFIRDISGRRQAEEQIRLLTQTIDTHADGAYWFDVENRFVYVNAAGCRALGYTREELIGKHLSLVNPDASDQALERVWERLRRTKHYTSETTHRRKDGSVFPAEISATYVRLGDREYNCGFARDISERKLAATALKVSEERYRDLFTCSPSGVCEIDAAGLLHRVDATPSMEHGRLAASLKASGAERAATIQGIRILGLNKSAREVFGLPHEGDIDPEALSAVQQTIAGILLDDLICICNGKPRCAGESALRTISGTLRQVAWEWNRGLEASGRLIMSLMDITERRKAETYREMGREILQILNEPEDLRTSMRRVLATLKERTGFDAVGVRLQAGEDFPYYVSDGFSGDFLAKENGLIERGADGGMCRDKEGKVRLECTCGLVLSGKTDSAIPLFTRGGSFWTNDSLPLLDLPADQDPRHHPRNECIHQGYASVALIPIRSHDRIVGLIHLNDRRKACFTLETIELLEGIAAHLGAAFVQRIAREALRASEEKYRAIFDESIVTIYVFDVQKRFLDSNQAGLDLLGYTREELLRLSIPDVDADPVVVLPAHAELLSGGRLINYEHKLRRKDGTVISVLNNSRPLTDPQGNIVGMLSTLLDVTARKQASEALRASEEKYRALVENSYEIVYALDADGVFTFVSPAWTTLLGHPVSEVVGHMFDPFVHPKDVATCREWLKTLITTGTRQTGIEYRVRHADGTWRWHASSGVPLKDDKGRVTGMRGSARDVTDRRRVQSALRESEANFRDFFESMADMVVVAARDGRILVANPAVSSTLGYSAGELSTMSLLTLHPARTRKEAEGVLAAIMRGERENCTLPLVRRDGVEIPAETRARFGRWNGQECIFWVCKDLSAETEAQESFERLFRRNPAPMAVSDYSGGQILDVNDVFVATMGYARDEVIGRTSEGIGFFTHPEERVAALIELKEKGSFRDREMTVRRKDGSLRYGIFSGELIVSRGRQIVLTVMIDVTERTRYETALRESESCFRSLVEAAPEGVFVQSEGRVVFANPVFMKMIGASGADKLIGAEFWPIIAPEWHETVRARIRSQRETGRAAPPQEMEYVRLDGTRIPVESTAVPVRFEEHDAHLVLVRDISERKRAEHEKAAVAAQLQQAQKMESVGRLAGGVAHDFNNMLGVIMGHAELAMSGMTHGHPLYGDLEEIRKAAERSANVTRQLLAFARKQTVSPRVLDLNEVVGGMLKLLRRLIGEDIALEWRAGAELWTIRVDPSQIDQILANLCVNARDAIGGTGKVEIATGNCTLKQEFCATHPGAAAGEYVRLSVADSGCGMSAEVQAHVFEPFFTTKAVGEGTGLGLATVYGAVKQNGGFIEVDSAPGRGTTFTIYLPRHVSKGAETGGARESGPAARGRETLLVVEDEPAVLELTKTVLALQGYTVLTAVTPGEAIGKAREHRGEIDLLLTDVVMPEMNGRDLAKNLLKLYPRMKRVFMSGYTADVIAHHGILEEGVRFIEKPYTAKDLATKVREALDG